MLNCGKIESIPQLCTYYVYSNCADILCFCYMDAVKCVIFNTPLKPAVPLIWGQWEIVWGLYEGVWDYVREQSEMHWCSIS